MSTEIKNVGERDDDVVIELDPKVWQFGSGMGYLLTYNKKCERQQCCIGIACTQLGIPDRVIEGKRGLEVLDHRVIPEALGDLLNCGVTLYTAYSINDCPISSMAAQRVKKLNKVCKMVGLRFKLKRK